MEGEKKYTNPVSTCSRYDYYKYYNQNKDSYKHYYREKKRKNAFNKEADEYQKNYWLNKEWKINPLLGC